jgi:hypothetical protein
MRNLRMSLQRSQRAGSRLERRRGDVPVRHDRDLIPTRSVPANIHLTCHAFVAAAQNPLHEGLFHHVRTGRQRQCHAREQSSGAKRTITIVNSLMARTFVAGVRTRSAILDARAGVRLSVSGSQYTLRMTVTIGDTSRGVRGAAARATSACRTVACDDSLRTKLSVPSGCGAT